VPDAEPSVYAADAVSDLERAKGFEPSTPTLARFADGLRHSICFYPDAR
jgi:hypothetical protein